MKTNEIIVCDTPAAIEHFRLASIRAQLRMEKVGLKSSGGALRPRLAKEFGLKPRASHDDFISAVISKMNALLAK